MPSTHKLIASYTVTTEVTSISFSSIPQTYSDLILVAGGSNSGNDYGGYFIRFNSTDYASTMLGRRLRFESSVTSDNSKEASWPLAQAGNLSAKSLTEYYIPNYSTSATVKSASFFGGSPDQTRVLYNQAWWSGTDAITTIDIGIFDIATNKFTAGSSAYLYGISNA